MTAGDHVFKPASPLVVGTANSRCQACVTIPARNEASSLSRCLDALLEQVDLQGSPLATDTYEVLLLLNNCTDHSAAVVRRWQQAHPGLTVHLVERRFAAKQAHVGTARRLLMDTAWHRLTVGSTASRIRILLSTDADTVVAPDWIAQNLAALEGGADVVGGSVHILPEELAQLRPHVQGCYAQDRLYAQLIATLEDLLDPQTGDPWPRHLDHFGSSLACTPAAYAAAGGMPAVSPLEDEAFVNQVRRAGLCLRHEPAVKVFTSARMKGRATIGLAGQFRLWSTLEGSGEAHRVDSAAFLEHRFRSLRRLRTVFETGELGTLHLPTDWWRDTFRQALQEETSCPGFLGAVYCDVLIAESFAGEWREPIHDAVQALQQRIAALKAEAAVQRQHGSPDTMATPLAEELVPYAQ